MPAGNSGVGLASRHRMRSPTSARISMPVDLCQKKSSIFVGDTRQFAAIKPSAICARMSAAMTQ